MRILAAIIFSLLLAPWSGAQVSDPALDTGRKLAPFVLALKPAVQMSPLPPWMLSPAVIHPETATIELAIPALWQVPSVEVYALSLVFNDDGDGGPAVEWRGPNGTTTTISTGLGEAGVSLGWNSRTLLLPRDLTREGGTLLISYYGKFQSLINLAIRPARENLLAVLGAGSDPALLDEALRVFERQEVSGHRSTPLTGDVRHGSVVEAELSANVEELGDAIEFVIPVSGEVEATMLRLQVLGIDPEASLKVSINGTEVGSVGFPAFRLDDPALVPDSLGRLVLAGWRDGALFIPARHWTSGENTLVLTLKRSPLESARPVFLKNTLLHVRFGASPALPATPTDESPEPDFFLPDPLVPDPADLPLPEIVTGTR